MVPTDSRKLPVDKPHQKVAQHISFFHSGVCNGRTIVIAMKKRGVDSNFKVLEPICGDLRNPKNSKFFHKSGLFNKMPSWFKSYMEFYIGTESYAIHFLKARVVVVCSRGFEIINLEELHKNRNLPDATNSDFGFIQERGDDLRPLGMYRCREHYLLCYNAFAFMVNVHGGLVRDVPLIEWEGVPQSVAFYYPYVIGFDPRFIEVRHVETVSFFFLFLIVYIINIKSYFLRVNWFKYWLVPICVVSSLLIKHWHLSFMDAWLIHSKPISNMFSS